MALNRDFCLNAIFLFFPEIECRSLIYYSIHSYHSFHKKNNKCSMCSISKLCTRHAYLCTIFSLKPLLYSCIKPLSPAIQLLHKLLMHQDFLSFEFNMLIPSNKSCCSHGSMLNHIRNFSSCPLAST